MNIKSHKRHAVLECVPVGQREMDKAPGYFKKAMQVGVGRQAVFKKRCRWVGADHFDRAHPCAGAMLTVSVSF